MNRLITIFLILCLLFANLSADRIRSAGIARK